MCTFVCLENMIKMTLGQKMLSKYNHLKLQVEHETAGTTHEKAEQ